MRSKKKILTLTSIIALGISILGAVIYAMPKTSVINNFEMGIVDIEITEYQNIKGVEGLYDETNALNVLPLTKISKIPRIKCDGNDCWVRAKIEFLNTEYLGEEDLYGFTSDWVKKSDGYFYYKRILKTGETTDLFQGMQLPVNFPQSEEGTRFFLNIQAEAIQAQNFVPDFTTRNPWGNVDIQLCGKEGTYDVTAFKDSGEGDFKIEYVGESETLIRNSPDFFTSFPYMMPGDTHRDVAKIENNSKRTIDLYFYSEEISESELDLLDRIELKITYKSNYEEKTVYAGPLRAKNIEEPILLDQIYPGEEGNFCFEIYVPKELDNQYTLSNDIVKWIFYTEYDDKKPPEIIKTGDYSHIGLYMLIAGILLALGCLFVNSDNDEKKVKRKDNFS